MNFQVNGSQVSAAQGDCASSGASSDASSGQLLLIRVSCAGIADRDKRLVDIVFRHGASQRFKFIRQDSGPAGPNEPADIILVNPFHPEGVRALAQARSGGASVPTVSVVPAASTARTNYTIQQERLGLELLPCLSRLMEQTVESAKPGVGLFNSEPSAATEPSANATEANLCAAERADVSEPASVSEQEPELTNAAAIVERNDTLLIGLNDNVVNQIEQTIALSGQLLVGCASLADPSLVLESIRTQETKFVVLARHLRGGSAFGIARRIRREFPDIVILVVCEKQVLLDHVLACFAGQVCLLSSRFGVKELTSAISKPLSLARARRRQSNRQFDWGSAHSPWLNTGTGQ